MTTQLWIKTLIIIIKCNKLANQASVVQMKEGWFTNRRYMNHGKGLIKNNTYVMSLRWAGYHSPHTAMEDKERWGWWEEDKISISVLSLFNVSLLHNIQESVSITQAFNLEMLLSLSRREEL